MALAIISIFYCDIRISTFSKDKLYSDTTTIPFNKVGLLLGTSKYLANGRQNPYYKNRIDATINLIRSKKIKYLIISGDNSQKNYNEPVTMKTDLINFGIDSSIIYLDYAGFRTFDSMIRLKEIFGQDSVTVISQQFHNERAIYLADKENIAAIGFNAKDVDNTAGLKTKVREKFARVKVFVDFLINKKPKFLGQKIQIG